MGFHGVRSDPCVLGSNRSQGKYASNRNISKPTKKWHLIYNKYPLFLQI